MTSVVDASEESSTASVLSRRDIVDHFSAYQLSNSVDSVVVAVLLTDDFITYNLVYWRVETKGWIGGANLIVGY